MGLALYRKYRPKKIAEVMGQDHIITTLSHALKKGNLSHAYLFTGPRGVGKTSVARILAHEINNLAYDESLTHLDIIEIDAASNRRIDEIRELREKVHAAPVSAKYKVYIIDEVHMLTKEAFNALLKTLEEPPAHVIFILATTEIHKLPDTIISRTQRFAFKPIDHSTVVSHLKQIAKTENISITDQALTLIARHGDGSFRDSISLLDQASTKGTDITDIELERMLGIASEAVMKHLLDTLETGTAGDLIMLLQQLREQGLQAVQLSKQLSQAIRAQFLMEEPKFSSLLNTGVMSELLNVSASHEPSAKLEIVLLQIVLSRTPTSIAGIKKQVATGVQPSPIDQATPPVALPESPKSTPSTPLPTPEVSVVSKITHSTTGLFDEQVWHKVLLAIKPNHNTLYSVARMAEPAFEADNLILTCSFAFHQKRLSESKNKLILAAMIEELTGRAISITCKLDISQKIIPPLITPEVVLPTTDSLDAISNIFGPAEVLE